MLYYYYYYLQALSFLLTYADVIYLFLHSIYFFIGHDIVTPVS